MNTLNADEVLAGYSAGRDLPGYVRILLFCNWSRSLPISTDRLLLSPVDSPDSQRQPWSHMVRGYLRDLLARLAAD